MKNIKTLIVLLFLSTVSYAQNPAPGRQQDHPILIHNGEIHVGNGSVFKGDILFENGIITEMGDSIENYPANIQRIDATGKLVYPGLISPFSTVGLTETASIRPTHDYNELGQINPSVRALIAHNTDSEVIPTIRGNGVLIGQTTPIGGLVSGRSSIMNYDGWNWEDAALKIDDGLWVNWPNLYVNRYDEEVEKVVHEKNKKYDEEVLLIKNLFQESKAYADGANSKTNQNLGALKGVWDKETKVFLVANSAKQIIAGLSFFQELGVKNVVLVGASEALLVKDYLKENKVPVLVTFTHRLPSSPDKDIWAPYKLPAQLIGAGIKTGMFYNDEYWRSRNLPFVAGTAAGHGLTKEQALTMITLTNAEILGVADKIGSLKEGKQATLFISTGDILDMKTAKVEQAFIQGKAVNLDDKQKRLYHKYAEKYGIE